jgi:hypothetical protein
MEDLEILVMQDQVDQVEVELEKIQLQEQQEILRQLAHHKEIQVEMLLMEVVEVEEQALQEEMLLE